MHQGVWSVWGALIWNATHHRGPKAQGRPGPRHVSNRKNSEGDGRRKPGTPWPGQARTGAWRGNLSRRRSWAASQRQISQGQPDRDQERGATSGQHRRAAPGCGLVQTC